jgi:hypothetical protein
MLAFAIPETKPLQLTGAERKSLWYSREELTSSCLEAKEIVKIINEVDGDYAAIDHTKVCVVGLEKFHGKKERDNYRKLLVKAVLVRQDINRGMGKRDADCLCEVSTMISNSFKEFALWQAAMHKFHATSSEPVQPLRRCSTPTNPGPAKRQRLASDFDFSTLRNVGPQAIPDAVCTSPRRVCNEIHQMMAGFCS